MDKRVRIKEEQLKWTSMMNAEPRGCCNNPVKTTAGLNEAEQLIKSLGQAALFLTCTENQYITTADLRI